jgi:hypothetical protein
MSTMGIVVAGLGSGVPSGTAGAMLSIGLGPMDIVAGLGALIVSTVGVMVVRRLQAVGGEPPHPVASPDPRGNELRKAA